MTRTPSDDTPAPDTAAPDTPTPDAPSQDEAPHEQSSGAFDPRMLEFLICPQTRQTLSYDASTESLISKSARLSFPIREGIPIMLVDEAKEIE